MADAPQPPWAGEQGLPTLHIIRAAFHVGTVIDAQGNPTVDARKTYWHHATGGVFDPHDLHLGERLLVDCGLLRERSGQLKPTPELADLLEGTIGDGSAVICARILQRHDSGRLGEISTELEQALTRLGLDPGRREELLVALHRHFDNSYRRMLGDIGEEIVVATARRELEELGYPDLARSVRRVSLESDQLGYDISAPRISGDPRLLEVKAIARKITDDLPFYISRTEAEFGLRCSQWALVVCKITDVPRREGSVIGWCGAAALQQFKPVDPDSARWVLAEINLPCSAVMPGLPASI